jgi:hypothetical protein
MDIDKELPIGKKYLRELSNFKSLKDKVCDALISVFGIDPDGDLPFDDITFDEYDSSFEFKQCNMDFNPSEDLVQKSLDLGFYCCWLCYIDGTEKSYCNKNNKTKGV